MREGSVSQIVHKWGEGDNSCMFGIKPTYTGHQARDVKNSERMLKPGMERTGVDKIGKRKLANSPQSLKNRSRNNIGLFACQPNESVNRVSNAPSFAHKLKHSRHLMFSQYIRSSKFTFGESQLTSCPTPSSPPSSDRIRTRGQPAP